MTDGQLDPELIEKAGSFLETLRNKLFIYCILLLIPIIVIISILLSLVLGSVIGLNVFPDLIAYTLALMIISIPVILLYYILRWSVIGVRLARLSIDANPDENNNGHFVYERGLEFERVYRIHKSTYRSLSVLFGCAFLWIFWFIGTNYLVPFINISGVANEFPNIIIEENEQTTMLVLVNLLMSIPIGSLFLRMSIAQFIGVIESIFILLTVYIFIRHSNLLLEKKIERTDNSGPFHSVRNYINLNYYLLKHLIGGNQRYTVISVVFWSILGVVLTYSSVWLLLMLHL